MVESIVLGVDAKNSVTYRVLVHADIEEAVEAMAEAFLQGEPTAQSYRATKKDWLNFTRMYVPRMADQGLTVIACDAISGNIIGGFLAEDFATPDPPEFEAVCAAMDTDWTPTNVCIEELEEHLKTTYGPVEPGKICHQWMLGVLPEARGRAIATNLTSHLLTLAKQKGYAMSFAEGTGAISTHILTKLGGDVQHFVDYEMFEHKGEKIFKQLPAQGHRGMSLVVFEHSQAEPKPVSTPDGMTEIRVTMKKGIGFYVNAVCSFLRGAEAKPALDGKEATNARPAVDRCYGFLSGIIG